MGSRIAFKSLYGSGPESALCSVLDLNGFRILLDCGWTEDFDVALLDPLKEVIPLLDAVLLSHADTAHLGALPYAIGRLGLRAPIYATQPTFRMGQMFMYDQYLSHHTNSDFALFDLDDVDTAFDPHTVHQLKHSQSCKLEGECVMFAKRKHIQHGCCNCTLLGIHTPPFALTAGCESRQRKWLDHHPFCCWSHDRRQHLAHHHCCR